MKKARGFPGLSPSLRTPSRNRKRSAARSEKTLRTVLASSEHGTRGYFFRHPPGFPQCAARKFAKLCA